MYSYALCNCVQPQSSRVTIFTFHTIQSHLVTAIIVDNILKQKRILLVVPTVNLSLSIYCVHIAHVCTNYKMTNQYRQQYTDVNNECAETMYTILYIHKL